MSNYNPCNTCINNNPEPYKPKPHEIAGFELMGYRLDDGKIRLGDDEQGDIVETFPERVEVCDVVYTLEYVKQHTDPSGKILSNLEWGVYV